jgi:hypothetical protein
LGQRTFLHEFGGCEGPSQYDEGFKPTDGNGTIHEDQEASPNFTQAALEDFVGFPCCYPDMVDVNVNRFDYRRLTKSHR